jgi:DNA replication protein DnaC
MSLIQIKNQMAELSLQGMLSRLELMMNDLMQKSIEPVEALDLLLQAEVDSRKRKRTESRVKSSKIRRGANFEDYDWNAKRDLTKSQFKELYQLNWLKEGRPLILVGPTGVGKTFLARAIGLQACEQGKHVLFLSITDFLENQGLARATNSYLKYREKLIKPDLLVLDDFGMRKFTSQEAEDLRDVLEQRSYGKSTLITTQLPLNHWVEVIGDPVIYDALKDRLEGLGMEIEIKGETYRKILGKRLDEKVKKK